MKSRDGKSQKEERRSEKRKSQKKEDAVPKVGKSQSAVFSNDLCASGESKSRLAKAAGAEPSVVARSKF